MPCDLSEKRFFATTQALDLADLAVSINWGCIKRAFRAPFRKFGGLELVREKTTGLFL